MPHIKWKQDFYSDIEPISMRDPLASTLGAIEDDCIIYYSYQDCVKLAGHSCPSVSSAFQITKLALKELYGEDTPERGGISVRYGGGREDGANGPIGQVMQYLTGAAIETGFHGLGGKFNRHNLFKFDESLDDGQGILAEFTRNDTGAKVRVRAIPGKIVMTDEEQSYSGFMPGVVHGGATPEEREKFYKFWQGKNRKILLEDHPGAFTVERV